VNWFVCVKYFVSSEWHGYGRSVWVPHAGMRGCGYGYTGLGAYFGNMGVCSTLFFLLLVVLLDVICCTSLHYSFSSSSCLVNYVAYKLIDCVRA
jgi:hypothetical protein